MHADAETVEDEERRLYQWRRSQFLRLGFDRGQSQRLAMSHADWHTAERLILPPPSGKGCPIDAAYEILT